MRLRLRLFLFAAVAMTLVIAERTISLIHLHADNLAAAESHVMDLAERSVGHYRQTIAVAQAVLLTLASDRHVIAGAETGLPPIAADEPSGAPSSSACAALTPVSDAFAEIDSLSLVTRDGIIRCSTVPSAVGLDISSRSYTRIALRGIANIESVRRSLVIDRPAIYAAQPIAAGNDTGVLAVILARVSMAELFPGGTFAELGPGGQAMVVGPDGTLLTAYPEGTYGMGLDLSHTAPVAKAMMYTRGTVLAAGPDGAQRIYAYARLPGTNMHLLVGVDQNSALGPAERAAWHAGLTMLAIGLAVLIGLAMIGERLIVVPIRSLAARLVRFGHGDANALQVRERVAELQPLAVAFETMANELSARETALRNANRHLNSLASLDALTGIPNRRSFDAVLPLQWNKAPQLALLMIDIDNFKLYNDHYGHKEGDRCIRSVAQALATTVRGSDVIARIGGEEFAVLMPDADIGTAADVADRLRRAVEALAIPHANAAGVVTVSVGAAACQPAPSLSPSELFVAADQALYAAKRAGRNGVRRADAPALHGVASSPEEGRPGGGTDAGG